MLTTDRPTLRQRLGCWRHERWQAELALVPGISGLVGRGWSGLHNRHERLLPGSDGASWVCDWQNSSWLTVARIFPRLGARLLKRCLAEWPVRLAGPTLNHENVAPKISVVLPVGGNDRLEQFKTVLQSFYGQVEKQIEFVVVEHSLEPTYDRLIGTGVKFAHLAKLIAAEGFNKSKAMNAGVMLASAPVVLLHDADTVVPKSYICSILQRFTEGWEAVRPVRFQFFFDREASEQFAFGRGAAFPKRLGSVLQNNPGVSVAMRREIYWEIGGHDEDFVGWGGEDLEFLERLRTIKLFRGAWAPTIHLWHPDAPKKASGDRNNGLMEEKSRFDANERIRRLRCRLNSAQIESTSKIGQSQST